MDTQEAVLFVLTNQESWKPGKAPGEEEAASVLLADATSFHFTFIGNTPRSNLVFSCLPGDDAKMFVRLAAKGPMHQKMSFSPTFSDAS